MPKEQSDIYEVGPDHMAAFGSIVQQFARYEHLMQSVISTLLQVPMSNIAFLTGGLGYTGKRDALLSLLRDIEIAEDRKERIRWFLGELHKFNQLRNHIAHSLWMGGTRRGSIKPIGVSARGGNAKYHGFDPKEQDYLLDDLIDIADGLVDNYTAFVNYLKSIDLYLKDPAKIEK